MTKTTPTARVTRRGALALGGLTVGGLTLSGASVLAQDDDGGNDDNRHYRVTVGNLTPGQPFTPPAVAAHSADVEVFAVGDRANEPVQELAENGNLDPLVELINTTNQIRGAALGNVPLVPEDDPGNTGNPYYTILELSADASAQFLTFVSMLVATNDGIVGLDTVPLPEQVNESRTYFANGYDVGTEQNTEQFGDLVPPAKTLILGGDPEGTTESNPDIAEEGVIRPHPGIEGVGNLPPEVYDWEEPAAVVQVERLGEPTREFSADLLGTREVPPVETDAEGEATVEVNDAGDALNYEITVSNIEDVIAAHIHCGRSGENGPVGVTLFEGDPVTPDGVLTEGTAQSPDEGNACGWATIDDVVAAIRRGDAYVNVHTQANQAGEIRGQLR